MNTDAQSIVAILIVFAALGYLWRSARQKRRSGELGCSSGGTCACPKPALPPHLKRS